MRKLYSAFLLLALLCALAGCGAAQTAGEPSASLSAAPAESGQETSKVADASQMTAVEDVVEEGMVPVYTAELVDGVYETAVDCSSSMFRIERCELRVESGAMVAKLTMSSTAYGYLFAGTAAEAAAADKSVYIEPTEENGVNTFVLPVEALDAGVKCAAWSRNKELWYDRTLVFRSDSLPLSAFKNVTTAASLGLADGAYTVNVALAGGSGRASVQSPAKLWIENGAATAEIVWSSANYDYMKVDGVQINTEVVDGHSTAAIPVAAFDRPLAAIADTTAMSQPYEIEYTLTFDSSTVTAAP